MNDSNATFRLQRLLRQAGVPGRIEKAQEIERMLNAPTVGEYQERQARLVRDLNHSAPSLAGSLQDTVTLKDQTMVWVLESPLIHVQLQKQIISTPLTNYQGTVKECIQQGDWSIRLKGLLCATDEKPLAQLRHLMKAVYTDRSLSVYSTYLNTLGIQNLVISQVQLPHSGYVNVVLYEITALSDKPFELKRKDQDILTGI